jgi:hypothetical protein
MPTSRHRRRGKPRPPINRKTFMGILSSPEACLLFRELAVLNDRLYERYGDRDCYTADELGPVRS